jgi:hypothetical protein
VCRYVERNAVRANLVKSARLWPWNSPAQRAAQTPLTLWRRSMGTANGPAVRPRISPPSAWPPTRPAHQRLPTLLNGPF